MEIRIGKNMIRIGRNSWYRSPVVGANYSIARNVGFGEVNRRDRETLGIAFIDLVCGPVHCEFYRTI